MRASTRTHWPPAGYQMRHPGISPLTITEKPFSERAGIHFQPPSDVRVVHAVDTYCRETVISPHHQAPLSTLTPMARLFWF
ncbi:hypothetical protein BaRGS_00000216 [Batillaria attramentaria]|uniref:Uncharacterized protein n=1 Tax=Batillaria attramentaria TaxID=370345 RepID=A0ABD0MBK9_9CAEN